MKNVLKKSDWDTIYVIKIYCCEKNMSIKYACII